MQNSSSRPHVLPRSSPPFNPIISPPGVPPVGAMPSIDDAAAAIMFNANLVRAKQDNEKSVSNRDLVNGAMFQQNTIKALSEGDVPPAWFLQAMARMEIMIQYQGAVAYNASAAQGDACLRVVMNSEGMPPPHFPGTRDELLRLSNQHCNLLMEFYRLPYVAGNSLADVDAKRRHIAQHIGVRW